MACIGKRVFKDLSGQVAGDWLILWPVGFKSRMTRWLCQRADGVCRVKTTDKIRAHIRASEKTVRSVQYLLNHPCVDCGETDPLVLDYDHVSGVKCGDVSQMIQSTASWARVEKEISKCVVRCANCHRRKTFKNTFKYRTILNIKQRAAVGSGHLD